MSIQQKRDDSWNKPSDPTVAYAISVIVLLTKNLNTKQIIEME